MTVQIRMNAQDLIRAAASPVAPAARGGIARGSLVRTARGDIPVEDLRPGDRVITRERGMVPIRAISPAEGATCVVRPDSLGPGRPDRCTVVAADQHLVVRDWRASALFEKECALVPAARLADGTLIAGSGHGTLYRLDLGAPMTVYVNGLDTPTGRREIGVIDRSET